MKTTNSILLIQYMCVVLILCFKLLRIYPDAKVCLQGNVIKTSIINPPNFKQQAEIVCWYMYIVCRIESGSSNIQLYKVPTWLISYPGITYLARFP